MNQELQCNPIREDAQLNVLAGFDQPFNQAPSLHLSLTVILWARHSAHLTGAKAFHHQVEPRSFSAPSALPRRPADETFYGPNYFQKST